MKATKWQRTVSLLLCLLMAMSFFIATAPKAYAAEPEWPHLTSVGIPTNDKATKPFFIANNLREDFTFTLKDVKIEHAKSLTECALGTTAGYTAYDAGTIKFYVDNLPTKSDKLESFTGTAYGFKFQTGNGLVTVSGTGDDDTVKFANVVMLNVADNFKYHNKTYYYIQTAKNVRYHYNVQVLQYEDSGEAEPTWPYLASIDESSFTNFNLRDDFPAPKENLKKVDIQHVTKLEECADVKTSGATTTYHAGTIVLYVATLPTSEDKSPNATENAKCGFKFQIGSEGSGTAKKSKITLKNVKGNYKEKFYTTVTLKTDAKLYDHSRSNCYIMTEDKIAYHYDVKVQQYTGEAGENLTLSAGVVKRTDKKTATVTFNASAAGNYYYALYDKQQTAPVVDTTSANTNTGAIAKTNTITVSGITDYKARYLYIVGVDAAGKASAPLEIVIPGLTFALKHEKQSIYSVSLYTEQFTDSEGKPITAATPGDTVIVNFGVFEAGNDKVIYEDGAIKHKASVRQTVLTQWNMTGLTLDPAPTGSSFRFTMPENDVTIQAETKLDGVPIHVTSNMPNVTQELEARAYFTNPYGLPGGNVGYTIPICANQDQTDVVMAGTKVRLRVVSIPETYVLDKWAITNNGTPVDKSEITLSEDGSSAELTLAEGGDYVFNAVLRAKKFASVTAAVNDSTMGSATVTVDGNQQAVYEGQNVTLTAIPGDSYMLERWEVREEDSDDLIATTPVEGNANQVTFTMPTTDKNITAKAFFAFDPAKASTECGLDSVELDVPSASVERRRGNFTIKVPANTSADTLAAAALKFITVSEDADVIRAGDETPWPTDGQACGMTLDTPVTFTVRSQKYLLGGDDNAKADYTVTVVRTKSTERAIESAKLGNVVGVLDQTKKTVTFTVPADTEDSAVADMLLTINCSQYASIKLKGAETDWVNDTACGMKLNEEKTFVVTAEDGTTTAEYTVVIHRTPSDKKALTGATLGDIAAVINEDSHAVTFTVPADTTDSTLGEMILKFTCSPRATVKLKDAENNWGDSGEACRLKLGVPATFVVTAEDNSTQEYTVTVNREKSAAKAITEAVLTKTGGTPVKAKISEEDKTVTFTLPVGTRDADVAAMTLKFTCSQYASIKLEGAETNWPADGQLCGMKLNEAKTFVVTAENGKTQAYTVLITRGKSSAKEITNALLLAKAGDTASLATVKIDNTKKTVDFTLPADTDTSKLGEMILKLTVSDYATVKKSGDKDNWPAEGKACGMELNNGVIFTVKAEDDTTVDYTVTIAKTKSSEKDITAAVLLNQTGDTTPFAKAQISGTNIIFTLPSDTDKAVLNSIGMKYLKLTYPESATAKMKNGYDDATNGGYRWSNGDIMCNMSINSPVKFTVTAENSSTKEYTIEIKYTAPAAPTLSNGSATRTSKTGATVKFTSSEAGNYFYKVVDHGAAVPTVDTSKSGTAAVKGENTITLSNLTEDARDIYIVVVGAAGGESAALKVEIPAYGSDADTPDTGAYKISIRAPKGGTITTNRTKADAGDEIIVTVTPDNGYQMVSGSLTYTLETAGGETKTITNGRFTMPAGDVSITCKWETATTAAKGITSFSINGVAGAVNNTTNSITITMPRGTDVTKLTPVIATNGVKSLTPGNGETVNFTNAVTYTATMEDGSSKTYTVTVYVEKGTLSDQFWDKLTDFVNQIPWWEYAKHQQSTSSYPKYW